MNTTNCPRVLTAFVVFVYTIADFSTKISAAQSLVRIWFKGTGNKNWNSHWAQLYLQDWKFSISVLILSLPICFELLLKNGFAARPSVLYLFSHPARAFLLLLLWFLFANQFFNICKAFHLSYSSARKQQSTRSTLLGPNSESSVMI